MLTLAHIGVQRGATPILHDISCRFETGKITALIGPNGAGKTSLLRIAAGLDAPGQGTVCFDADDFHDAQIRAKKLAYLPQFQNIAWPLLCRDVVALGLVPFGVKDEGQVAAALHACGVAHFAERPIDTLSGGEAARVHMARLLVGDAPILLLDEPVQSLDAAGAKSVMQLLRQAANDGKAVGLVVHELNLAQHFCDDVLLLHEGRCVAQGPPRELFTPAQLAPIFKTEFFQLEADGRAYVLPHYDEG